MAGKQSKDKGKRYEREIAKFLTSIYNEPFTRVPYSGAFVGGKNATRRNQLSYEQEKAFKGDIIPPENWNLVIECKNYDKLSGGLAAIIRGESIQLNKWIKELRGDAGELAANYSENLDPHILFLKITRVGEWVIVPSWMAVSGIPNIIYFYEMDEYHIYDIKYFTKLKDKIKQRSSNA